MKLHVVCVCGGVIINFGFPAGGGGHVKIATKKLLTIFLHARFLNINLLFLFSQATKFLNFCFYKG